MNSQIQFYVDELQSNLMAELYEEKNTKLVSLANHLIKDNKKDKFEICQAYEVVKHQLLG